MTPLAALLARIGWTTGELAGRLDVSPDTTRQWASGRRTPPPDVMLQLEPVARAVERAWRQPDGWNGVRGFR
jgi:transcriptional regulator with XRE-family HTH domain